jgi:S-DNA-T family DNA segregation ATPase FtsK/SpoIIIE
LMMASSSKKDTETAIARIAQKARAVWMHLIVATQRPSVNVITWIIKANIPTRIAFGVISQVDSRTILDVKWAEDLMWKWDLLYMDPNTKFPLRVQAPFVSTEEIDQIVQFIKDRYMQWISEQDIYYPEIVNILENKGEYAWGGEISEEDEQLVQQAIEIIRQTRRASATLLQRKLWIGFARAARIMDILEQRWIVWPQQGAKPREIYI